jgi:diguanylate cyclase (GGDEF)-like protein
MYLPFVMLGYAGILCLVLAGCWLVSRAVPRLRGLRELSWAVGTAIASVVLVGLRPWASAFLSILVGNCTLFAYFLLIYWTTARILAQRARALPWLIGFSSVALLPFSFYTFIRPDTVIRIVLAGGVAAVIAALTGVMLFRQNSPDLEPSAAALGWVQAFSAALYLGRSVASVLYPPVHLVSGDWIQTCFTYGQMLARLGTCCGVLWLAVCVHRTELEQLAMSDSLTGLLNRRAFDEILTREMHRCEFTGATIGLILVDIDRFKNINDTYGHGQGDAVIRQTGEILRNGIRPGDALARYGGEEFVILLHNANSELLIGIAERLRADIEQTVVGPRKIHVTASLGVAESSPSDSPLEFVNRCDRALYRAKNGGRNGVCAFAT